MNTYATAAVAVNLDELVDTTGETEPNLEGLRALQARHGYSNMDMWQALHLDCTETCGEDEGGYAIGRACAHTEAIEEYAIPALLDRYPKAETSSTRDEYITVDVVTFRFDQTPLGNELSDDFFDLVDDARWVAQLGAEEAWEEDLNEDLAATHEGVGVEFHDPYYPTQIAVSLDITGYFNWYNSDQTTKPLNVALLEPDMAVSLTGILAGAEEHYMACLAEQTALYKESAAREAEEHAGHIAAWQECAQHHCVTCLQMYLEATAAA